MNKGSALAEFLITSVLLFLFLAGIFQFGKIFLIKQRLLMGARYGAWSMRNNDNAEQETKKMLKDELPSLSEGKIKITAETVSMSNFFPSKSHKIIIKYEISPVEYLKKMFPKMTVEEHCVLTGDPWKYGIPKK